MPREISNRPNPEPRFVPLLRGNPPEHFDKGMAGALELHHVLHEYNRSTRECENRSVTAHRPEHATLTGDFVRLEPLNDDHIAGLYEAIGRREIFEFGFGGGASVFPESADEFTEWAKRYFAPDGDPYAVVLLGGPRDGTIVGTTTLGDFDERREAAHIGWTAYDPRVWGTAVNPEAKLLLLQHAFDAGFGRIRIQTDALNKRARAAIAKLGATFEGVIRRDQQRGDGSWRDSAVYSVIVEEWPQVKKELQTRLSRFEGRPVLFRTPRV